MNVPRHSHSGRGGDGEKIKSSSIIGGTSDSRIETHNHDGTPNNGVQIDYDDLTNKPGQYLNNVTTWKGAFTGGSFFVNTGFKPKYITIYATGDSIELTSEGQATINDVGAIVEYCMYTDGNDGNQKKVKGTMINIEKSQITQGFITSVTTSGFYLFVSNNNYQFDTIIYASG